MRSVSEPSTERAAINILNQGCNIPSISRVFFNMFGASRIVYIPATALFVRRLVPPTMIQYGYQTLNPNRSILIQIRHRVDQLVPVANGHVPLE